MMDEKPMNLQTGERQSARKTVRRDRSPVQAPCAADALPVARQPDDLARACVEFSRVLDQQEVLRLLLKWAVELSGASGGSAGPVLGEEIVITDSYENGVFRQLSQGFGSGHGAVGRAAETGETVIENGGRSAAVPVLSSSGELLCCFELHSHACTFPEGGDESRLQALAGMAALALENARMRSERLESDLATAAASSLLSATIESTVDGIMAVDSRGEIVACNRRFAEMWSIGEEALASGDSNKLLVSLLGQVRDPVRFFEKVGELYWQPELESYDLVELNDGRCFERFSRPRHTEGKAAGRVWTFHDITELKKLEAQLLHAQKMEAIGTLAGGIAHDFNNIMTAVIGYTELLTTALDPPAPFSGYLESISSASNRAVALIRNLLAYSRKEPVQTSKLECNALVRNLMGLLERLIGDDIVLVMKPSDAPLGILADQGQIEQVLVNLATNARDAMPEGGRLTLEVARVELSADAVQGHASAKPGSYVRVAVSDTGLGIDEATRNRIFEPFFTTKEVGKGTGLGLSISYGIVKRHGGFLSVTSEDGCGTTFSVHLPRVESAAEAEIPASPSKIPPGGKETVLLVEDNEPVRTLLSQVLTARGYRVIEAADGEDGVAQFRRSQDEIELVILDVIMPGKNGGDAFEEIRALRSDVPAIFISGYTGDIIDRQRIRQDGANFLVKPILPEKLLSLVREVLETPRPALPEVA